VRLGSQADMCAAKRHVRFIPNSDRKSRHRKQSCPRYPRKRTCAVQQLMSALGQERTTNSPHPPCFRATSKIGTIQLGSGYGAGLAVARSRTPVMRFIPTVTNERLGQSAY